MQAVERPLQKAAVVVRLRGDCDLARKDEVRLELGRAKGAGIAIVDISDAGYIDSACLGEIVRLSAAVLHNGGKVKVIAPHAHQKKIFNLVGLNKKIELFDSMEEASAPAA